MKIAVIGGAGVRTVNFVNGLLDRQDAPDIGEVALYDIDTKKLAVIEQLSQHAVRRRGGKLNVHAAADIPALLDGADAVVTTLRVGGDRSRASDEEIALRHGVIGQETTGAGGFFMAARTVWPLLGYMEQVATHAPKAHVFNFTNPSGLVTQALHDAGFPKVIGICDAPSSTVSRMAEALRVLPTRLDVRFAGLNHLSWITSVRLDGEEQLPTLINDSDFIGKVQEFAAFDPASFRLSGCLPNEYLYYYYHREQALQHIQAAQEPRGRMIERINRELFAELYAMKDIDQHPEDALQTFLYHLWRRELSYMSAETGRESASPKRGTLQIPSGMGYAGVMLDCLSALYGTQRAHVVLNVPNAGTLDCLSDSDIAELSCEVSPVGIVPLPAAALNRHCQTLIRTVKSYERTAAEAILTRSKPKAVEALTLHPLVLSYSLAKALVDDCIAAYPNDVELM